MILNETLIEKRKVSLNTIHNERQEQMTARKSHPSVITPPE